MSTCNDISFLIDVQDENITFSPGCVTLGEYNGKPCKFISGELTYDPTHCEKCGIKNENYVVIRNGKQTSRITLPMAGTSLTFLKLKKQRFFCKACRSSFMAKTSIVETSYRNFYNYKKRIMIHFKFKAIETKSLNNNQKESRIKAA
ncbi:transposase family protein [Amphibacillus sp. Q70]|uniref:transposase family protein n=1 Tax=Amphibacillus sp. Q70 TaxID=3453416 RepID=UPI003F871F0D